MVCVHKEGVLNRYYFTQEESHRLGEGGEEHARGYVSKNTTNLLMKLLLGHPLIPLLRNTNGSHF